MCQRDSPERAMSAARGYWRCLRGNRLSFCALITCFFVTGLILIGEIRLLASHDAKFSRGSLEENFTLVLVVVSDSIPNFHRNAWALNLAIESFLKSFRLPQRTVDLKLKMFIQCSQHKFFPAQPADAFEVNETHREYVSAILSSVFATSRNFEDVEIFCGGHFASAFCHRSLFQTKQPRKQFVFMLEHDWLLLPSRINARTTSLLDLMSAGFPPMDYVLLQRGRRPVSNVTIFQMDNFTVYHSNQYANNPFLASSAFFEHFAGSEICSGVSFDMWERRASRYARASPLKMGLLTSEEHPEQANVYHMDGRFIEFARQKGIGVMFNRTTSHGHVTNKESGSRDSGPCTVEDIDRKCRLEQPSCGPYFLRTAFVHELESYITQFPCVHKRTFNDIAHEYVQKHNLSTTILSGYFPGRREFESTLRHHQCSG